MAGDLTADYYRMEGESMKAIVVYKSKTGFTKKYAEWIHEATKFDILSYDNTSGVSLSTYDLVIFGSRIHAGRIDGYKKAKELFDKSASKRFVVFATGATPNDAEDVIREFWSQNLSDDELGNIPHFYMQSGLCYEKMSFLDKTMMKMVASMLKKKEDKNAQEKGFEQAITSSYDISSKTFIEPLVSLLKK